MESVKVVNDQLEKPLTDNRTYCVVRLPNDLEALLVHDPTTDEAGACMDVEVGNMSDEIPGTAHALEHLVLRGTEKYPGENDFKKYIASYSGSSNAHTSGTHTNYHLKVAALPSNGEEPTASNPSPLLGALDRLSRLAIDPLIHPETVSRELHAVDSEYKMNLRNDGRRIWQLEKSTSNPKHSWSHFGTGNLQVLKEDTESRGINIRDILLHFHEKQYSANRTKICILGRETIPLLVTWAVQCFSSIQNKHLKPNRWPEETPYTKNELGMQFFVKPVTSYRQLILTFPFLDETDLYESPPSQYISYLLSHKNLGSILAYVKDKGWATGIWADSVAVCSGSPGIFRCHISLTQEGRKCYKEVVKVFFQYIALLKQSGPQKRIFDEAKYIAQLRFKYREKIAVENFAMSVTARMQGPIPRKWLLAPDCQIKFAPELITNGIDCLRPDNLRIMVVAPEGSWDKKEKWYGTEYSTEPMAADFIAELTKLAAPSTEDCLAELYLPRPNPFLPTDLGLKLSRSPPPGKQLFPEVVRNDERARTWWMDNAFGVPKAYFVALLRSPLLIGSPDHLIKTYLLTSLIRDKLQDSAYEAAKAGLSYSVSYESRGLFVSINGYNDKLPDLLELIITTIKDLEIRDDRFKIIKDDAIDSYRNMDFRVPYSQAKTWMTTITTRTAVGYESQAALLPHVDVDAVRCFKQDLLSQFHIEVYAHGNVDRAGARKLTTIIESVLDPVVLPPASWPVVESLALKAGFTYRYEKSLADPKNVNNCIEYYVYGGDRAEPVLRAKIRLLSQLISKIASDWLRTKLQLGYVVQAFSRPTSTAYGFSIIVQGEKTCRYMEKCTTAFLKTYLKWLEKTSESEFETQKHSLISSIIEKPKNLYEAFNKYWTQIDDEYYNFELAQEYAVNIEALTKADMIEFYKRYVDPSSPQVAKLVVNINSHVKTNTETNEDLLATVNDPATSDEDIKKHLKLKLKVDETELDDAVELWREICMQNQNTDETEVNGSENSRVFNIDDLDAFKASADVSGLPSLNLSKFEWQG